MLSLANLAAELLRHEPAKVDTPRKLRFKKNEPFAFGENESLRGGIARACHLAGVPNSFTVLGEFGQRHRNVVAVAEDPNIDETGLAEALDVDLREIVKRRYPKAMSGKRYFHGLWLPANSIDIRTRRFAPTFLAKKGYHHAAWELKFLPFCPETWDILQSHCNTCKSQARMAQGWIKTMAHVAECDTCGRSLTRQPAVQVEAHLQRDLQILARLVAPNGDVRRSVREILPPALQRCEPQALLDVILCIAKNVVVPAQPSAELQQISKLHAACQAVTRWPHALSDLKLSISPDSPVLTSLFQEYASLGAEPAAATAAIELSKAGAGLTPPVCSHQPRTIIGLREATAMAGLTADQLRQIWTAKLITKRYKMHGGELHPAFEAEELSMFAKAWKAQIPARAVAHRFGLPNYAIEQCAQLNLLEPSSLVLPQSGYAFKADQIERFASQFSPNMTEPQSSAMCLKDAMRQVSGRLKPWGLILSQICNGSLPAVITEGPDDRLISRIWIDPTAFDNILSSHFQNQKDCVHGLSEMLPQADALEILNCSATSAGILQGLDTQGLNPKLFRLDQVVQRAREVVATSDIAARFQLDNTRTYHLLRTAKIREVVPSGWDRQAAFQLVARNNALKAAQLALEF